MNQRTCLSCDHYGGEKDLPGGKLIYCIYSKKHLKPVPMAACDYATDRTPGSDEEEYWDELPDGEGFV